MSDFHSLCRETTIYKEFRGFCYGVLAAFVAVMIFSASTQQSVCFTAHNSVSVKKIQECDCVEPPVILPVPKPIVPHPHKKKDGSLGEVR